MQPETLDQQIVTLIIAICSKHGCWVKWDTSDPWGDIPNLDIDGPSTEAMIDCAEELERVLNQHASERGLLKCSDSK